MGLLQVGDMVPDFEAPSTSGNIRFYDWLDGGWAVMLVYPETITADSATELRAIAALQADFAAIGCKVIALVAYAADDFEAWTGRISDSVGKLPPFPIVQHTDPGVPVLHGTRDRSAASRTLFVVGSDRRVKLATAPAVKAGMFGEILRLVESLQYAGKRRSGKPARRGEGEKPIQLPAAQTKPAAGFGDMAQCFPLNGCRKDMPKCTPC